MDKHIILIGFKHVGKSSIAIHLAEKLQKNFIDLDREIEVLAQSKLSKSLSCRQIMQLHGENFFRALEAEALSKVIHLTSSVIALGGGTLCCVNNQNLVKSHHLVHVTASPGTVFERIIVQGIPAFFDFKEEPVVAFKNLWNERQEIYQKLCTFSIKNDGSVEQSVKQIIDKLFVAHKNNISMREF